MIASIASDFMTPETNAEAKVVYQFTFGRAREWLFASAQIWGKQRLPTFVRVNV